MAAITTEKAVTELEHSTHGTQRRTTGKFTSHTDDFIINTGLSYVEAFAIQGVDGSDRVGTWTFNSNDLDGDDMNGKDGIVAIDLSNITASKIYLFEARGV